MQCLVTNRKVNKTEIEMENFEFEDKFNPWDVNNLDDFRFYYCPECDFRNVTKNDFIKHAVTSHPKSHDVIDKSFRKKILGH